MLCLIICDSTFERQDVSTLLPQAEVSRIKSVGVLLYAGCIIRCFGAFGHLITPTRRYTRLCFLAIAQGQFFFIISHYVVITHKNELYLHNQVLSRQSNMNNT